MIAAQYALGGALSVAALTDGLLIGVVIGAGVLALVLGLRATSRPAALDAPDGRNERPPAATAAALITAPPALPPDSPLELLDEAAAAAYVEASAAAADPRKARYYRATLRGGGEVIIGHTPGAEWADVLAPPRLPAHLRSRATAPRACYGFNVRRSCWSHGQGPHGARQIRGLLRQLEPGITARETA